jgi:hypothetical protein
VDKLGVEGEIGGILGVIGGILGRIQGKMCFYNL